MGESRRDAAALLLGPSEFARFVTTEYTTVGARRQPITWPVTPYYTDGGPTIDKHQLGYPKKADDAKRHPSVALLFSDPTGSGLERPAQVLVRGTAEVDDADLAANRERYWRESSVKLPSTRDMHPPPVRAVQLVLHADLRPRAARARLHLARGDVTAEPELHDAHPEEVRSGTAKKPPEDHGAPQGGPLAWDDRLDELEGRGTAVVSWLAPDGFPLAARLPVRVDRGARVIHLAVEPRDPCGGGRGA